MSHTIKSRSPYFINHTATDLASATLELYIYTGQQTTGRPASATYTLFSTAVNSEVVFEVGQLINDKIQFINDSTYRTDGVWVDYRIIETLTTGTQTTGSFDQHFAVDGYTYFDEGANYSTYPSHLMSADFIRVKDGEDFKIAINRNYYSNGATISSITTRRNGSGYNQYNNSSSDLSGQVIHYYTVSYDAGNTDVRLRLSDNSKIDIPITYEEECKFDSKKITFINKCGAMEDIWFLKRSDKSINVESQTFQNNNILSGGTYSIQQAQYKKYAITSKESMSLNTGFIREEFNETFTQLMQSESVWITEDRQFKPVIIKSQDLGYKTALNDKLINYTIEIEYAFNKMNTVR